MKKLLQKVLMLVLTMSLGMSQMPVLAEERNTENLADSPIIFAESDKIEYEADCQEEHNLSESAIKRIETKQISGETSELKADGEEHIIADDCFELSVEEWGSGKQSRAITTLSSSQIADYANSLVGNSYASGYCLRFVADVFANLGAARSSTCCAYNYGSSHITSNDINSIPVGADVFFGNCGGDPCSSYGASHYGHIEIYVGDGYFVHATGGKVQKTYLPGTSITHAN